MFDQEMNPVEVADHPQEESVTSRAVRFRPLLNLQVRMITLRGIGIAAKMESISGPSKESTSSGEATEHSTSDAGSLGAHGGRKTSAKAAYRECMAEFPRLSRGRENFPEWIGPKGRIPRGFRQRVRFAVGLRTAFTCLGPERKRDRLAGTPRVPVPFFAGPCGALKSGDLRSAVSAGSREPRRT